MEIAKIRECEEALRQDTRTTVVNQQVLDDKTTQTCHETRILEQDFEGTGL
jgi:hypothetical protein